MRKNRLEMKCPVCGGNNDIRDGGNENCFHCDTCGWVECKINITKDYTTKRTMEDHLLTITKRFEKFYEGEL